jgi:hypothetical protein
MFRDRLLKFELTALTPLTPKSNPVAIVPYTPDTPLSISGIDDCATSLAVVPTVCNPLSTTGNASLAVVFKLFIVVFLRDFPIIK